MSDFAAFRKKFATDYKAARPLMTIMGDEVRQEIVMALIETGGTGGIRVGEIQKRTHVSRSAVSHHLRTLLDAEIISVRREGTKNYYYMNSDSAGLKAMMSFWRQAGMMMEKCNQYNKEREKK